MSHTSDAAESPLVGLVMGGSRGLGLLVARQLLNRGYTVVVTARDDAELSRAAAWLEGGDRVHTKVCDVGDRHQVGQVVGEVSGRSARSRCCSPWRASSRPARPSRCGWPTSTRRSTR